MKFFIVSALLFFVDGVSGEHYVQATTIPSKKTHALCLKTDRVSWWEITYCQVFSGADDDGAAAYLECAAKYKKDKSVPATRCPKIIWLKEKTCHQWKFLKPVELGECLQNKDFPRKIKDNYEYYHGG